MKNQRLTLPLRVAIVASVAWLAANGGRAAELPGAVELRAAISDLTATCSVGYPHGKEYLARLDHLQRRAEKAAGTDAEAIQTELDALRREALIANPLVSGQPLLLVVRPQYRPDHHNTETMFQTGEINTASFQGGGTMKSIDLARGGEAKTIVDVAEGIARDPDVSFDGRKVLFSMRRDRQDDYHLYEVHADGSGLVQLTFGSGVSDIDPIYLPSGQILFTSTREPKYCMCNRHIMGNLFTINADGSNLQQIGHSTLHEGHPSLMPDGRILYDRWEYVDRNFGDNQGSWTCNPDGTNHAVYYGAHTSSPGVVLDARIVRGSEAMVATFSSCHDRPWGAIALVDRRLGVDGRRPVVRTWPATAVNLVEKGGYDTFKQVTPKYEDPYPLSDKYFLCSRQTGQGEQMGIYLLDVFGNEILLHVEGAGCFDPMPLAPRETPPAIPSRVDLAQTDGYFYVSDVYRGAGMEQIERGSVKRLRVVESPEKRFWTGPNWDGGTGAQAPGMAWNDFNNKQILGSVPVEPDGSAYFAVPADRFVYFQLLDEKGMMVQSMRSGTIVRPGERSGCIGCHEYRLSTVPPKNLPLAMLRAPSRLEPWYGPTRKFGYLAEVQPVLDRRCVSCHDYGKPDGENLNLAGDQGLIFNTSYVELRKKDYVSVVGAGPSRVLMPKTWGSHASRLMKVLLEGHKDPKINSQITLGREDIERIAAWIDVNAPYYPEYATAYPDQMYGRSPLDNQQIARLGELASVDLRRKDQITAVSFSRPEWSRCLAAFTDRSDPRYREALSIVEAGRESLRQRPAADMPGFQLVSPAEIRRQEKYDALRQVEAKMREAIVKGEKKFDR